MLLLALAAAFTCTPAQVWDGDSFTCEDGTKVRVAATSTREIKRVGNRMLDNGCKESHPCPAMDAVKARDVLVSKLGRLIGTGSHGHVLVKGPALRCVSNGSAGRGRIGAWCTTPAGDLFCAMVKSGAAAYWPEFDKKRRMCR